MNSITNQEPILSNGPSKEKTWIQGYPSISGKEFSLDVVGSGRGCLCLGEEEDWPDLD